MDEVSAWDEAAVAAWLDLVGLGRWRANFIEHNITGNVIFDLDSALLREMKVDTLGDRVRILAQISRLREKTRAAPASARSPTSPSSSNNKPQIKVVTRQEESSSAKKFFTFENSPLPKMMSRIRPPAQTAQKNTPLVVAVKSVAGTTVQVDLSEVLSSGGKDDLPLRIREKLFNAHGVSLAKEYGMYHTRDQQTHLLTDAALVDLCSNLGSNKIETILLRKMHKLPPHANPPVLPEKPAAVTLRKQDTFGERPSSRLIATNLELFFPALSESPVRHSIRDTVMRRASSAGTATPPPQQQQQQQQRQRTRDLNIVFEDELDDAPTIYSESRHSGATTTSQTSSVMPALPPDDDDDDEKQQEFNDDTDTLSLRRVRNWEKGELIGKGSFAKVFHGLNVDTGDIMAVKQVELTQINSKLKQKMVDALQREMTLYQDLDHPNIVRYYGCEDDGDTMSVFLEYVGGGSVSSALAKIGKFDEPIARSIVAQTLRGLCYLHQKGVIHRDIKGGNILIDEAGTAKITDFGLSKKDDAYSGYKYNSRLSVQGSVYWMAPEVAKGKGYSAKVDVWSIGCLALEMLTGTHPWQNLNEAAAMFQLGNYKSPPLPQEGLSDTARDFLNKCLLVNPEQRPTADECLKHEFCTVPAGFDFKKSYDEALQQSLDDEEYDDDDEEEYYDEDEEEEEEEDDQDEGAADV